MKAASSMLFPGPLRESLSVLIRYSARTSWTVLLILDAGKTIVNDTNRCIANERPLYICFFTS